MKKKLLGFILVAVMVAGVFAGCTNAPAEPAEVAPAEEPAAEAPAEEVVAEEPAEDAAPTGGRSFGLTAMDLTMPVFAEMEETLRGIIEANGDSLVSFDAALDNEKQITGIEDMITSGIEVLFLNPVSTDGILPALQMCQDAGVKVINFDSKVADPEYIETFIANDNYKQGYVVGEEIVKNNPDGGTIAIIDNPLAESVVSRVEGLLDALGDHIEVVETKSISTYDEVLPAAEDILSAHPDLDIFWGLNDDVSLMIYGTVQAAGMDEQVQVYAPDGSPEVKKSIKDGGIVASAAQSPATWGELCAEACYKILDGEEVEPEYLIDTFVINIDNVDEYGTDGWQ